MKNELYSVTVAYPAGVVQPQYTLQTDRTMKYSYLFPGSATASLVNAVLCKLHSITPRCRLMNMIWRLRIISVIRRHSFYELCSTMSIIRLAIEGGNWELHVGGKCICSTIENQIPPVTNMHQSSVTARVRKKRCWGLTSYCLSSLPNLWPTC